MWQAEADSVSSMSASPAKVVAQNLLVYGTLLPVKGEQIMNESPIFCYLSSKENPRLSGEDSLGAQKVGCSCDLADYISKNIET